VETNRGDSERERERGGEGERVSGGRTGRGRNRREESERLVEKITNRGGVARDAADVSGCGEKGQRGNGGNELDKDENIGLSRRETKG